MNPFACFARNKPRIGRKGILVSLLVIFLFLAHSSARAQGEDAKQHLLVLNSYHQGFTWTNNIMAGISEVFAGTETELEIHVEYMDTKRRLDDEYLENLYDFYREKYASIPIDAIIISDNNALEFMRTYGAELFPDKPIIFTGINNFTDELIADFDQITGVAEQVDFAKSIDLMLALHPDTEQIYVVNDQTPTGVAVAGQLQAVIPNYTDQVDFITWDESTITELQNDLAQIPANSLVLMVLVNRDAAGQFFTNEESMLLVSRAADVPVYSVWDFYLGHGLVGGWLTSGTDQGLLAGEMAQRILQGEAATNIPIVRESPNRYLFDYEQLTQFEIPLNQLPADSTIINRPVSFYEQYRTPIWAAGIVMLILAASVVMLSVNVAQRQRAETALQESYRRRGRQVEVTTQVAQAIAAATSLEELYQRVVDEVREQFGYYHTQILRYSPELDTVQLIAGYGETGAQMKREGHQMPLGRGLIGQAAATGTAVLRPNLTADPDWQPNPLLPRTRGEIAVPIKMGNDILGVLDVQSDQAGALSADDQLLLEGLCGQIAVAIRNTETGGELRRLAQVVEQSLDGTAVADLDGNIEFVNPAWAAMHGYTTDELVGRHLSLFHNNEQLEEELQPVNEEVRSSGQVQQAEVGHLHRDGTPFPTWMTINLLRDADGNPTHLAAWAQDITARKEAEAQILQEQQRVHTILESISVPLLVSRLADGRVLYINEPLAEIVGIPASSLMGQAAPDFYYEPADRAEFVGKLQTHGKVTNHEMRMKRGDGELFWALISARIIDFEGEASILTTALDITERIETQEMIKRHADELATVSRVGTAAATILDPDTLLTEVVNLTKSNFDLYHAHIYLLDDEQQAMVLKAGAGGVGAEMVASGRLISLDKEQSLVARAARTGAGVVVNDVRAEAGFLPNPLLPDTRSEMAVPIAVGGLVLGVLDVQSTEVGRFTEQDVNIYTTLAAQIAVALQNAEQHEETQKALAMTAAQAQRLATLNEMSSILTTATTVDEVYKVTAAQILNLIEGDRVSVAMLDEESQTLELLALSGREGAISTGVKLPLAETAVGLTVRTGVVKIFPQDAPLDQFMDTRQLQASGLQSMMAVPMIGSAGPIGTFNVASSEANAYGESDINFVRQVASLLTANIESRRLDERARLLASIVENHPDFIGVGTLAGEALYVNPKGLAMMGLPPDHDVTQMTAANFYADKDAALLREEGIPIALEAGSWSAEVEMLTADGNTIPVEETVGINYDAAGNPVSFSITMHDISNRRQAAAYQQRLRSQLEEQLAQVNALQRAMTREGWEAFLTAKERMVQGYQYNQDTIRLITGQQAEPDADGENLPLSTAQALQIARSGAPTTAAAPMQLRGETIGFLGARHPDGKPIDPETQQVLRQISEQVAEALERARLFEETEQARNQTEDLFQGSERVIRAGTIDDILKALVEATALRRYDSVSFFFFDRPWEEEKPETITLSAVWRRDGSSSAIRVGTEMPLATYPVLNFLRRDEIAVIDDIEASPRLDDNARALIVRGLGMRGLLTIPMIAANQWFGFVLAMAKDSRMIDETDRRQLDSLAGQAAIVAQTQRLYQAAESRARQEQLLREVTARVSAAVDAESVLQTATREIGRALGLQTFVYLKPPQQKEKRTTDGNGRHE